MHQVLDHIDRQLDKSLDLESLAEVAHFSPFHFHRLFAAWMGETLGDYLRRRRVEVAAMRLVAAPSFSAHRCDFGWLRLWRGVRPRVQDPIRMFSNRVAQTK